MKEATVKISVNRITIDKEDDGYPEDHFCLVIKNKDGEDITVELTDNEFTQISKELDLSVDKELIQDPD